MPDDPLRHVVSKATDGLAVDWAATSRTVPREEGAALEQLRALAPLLDRLPVEQHRLVHLASAWERTAMAGALVLGIIKIAAAMAGALAPGTWAATAVPTPVFTIVVLVFAASGVVLLAGGNRDERARALGWLNLFTATAFGDRQITALAAQSGPLAGPIAALAAAPVDAFAPAALWLFVARFPDAPAGAFVQRLTRRFTRLAVITGLVLLASNLAGHALGSTPSSWWGWLDRHDRNSYYWQLAYLTLPAALAVLLVKARHAAPDERRRVGYFCLALLAGFSPVIVASILASPLSPVAWWFAPDRIRLVGVLVFAGLLSLPLTTAWVVMTTRVLDVRFLARAAIRSALTRGALATATALPFVLLVRRLYAGRRETLEALAISTDARALAGLLLAGLLALAVQPRLKRWVEHRLLRERPDAARAAARVVAASRRARSARELAEALGREVEDLYQPEVVAVLALTGDEGMLVCPTGAVPALPADGALAHLARDAHEVVSVDPLDDAEMYYLLPEEDREWMRCTGVRYFVPLRARDDQMVGLLAVGRRRGEMRLLAEDLAALAAVAGSAGSVLAMLRAPASGDAGGDAVECAACGVVSAPGDGACGACGGSLRAAPVPDVVAGKYRITARLGRGGMGTVYRAHDLRLHRDVAVKALHDVDVRLVETLLAEARMSAGLGVGGVAQVFAVETWRDVPLLVMEYLPGGTLAERIDRGVLTTAEVARIGARLFRTLAELHARGIAHRDIKPGNVGFTASGAPTLLDLGLAGEARARPWDRDQVGGTPRYVAPFILAGSSDYARGDIWSLCITLLEAAGDSTSSVALVSELHDIQRLAASGDISATTAASRFEGYGSPSRGGALPST